MTGEQFLNSIRYLDMEITALDTSRVRMENRRQDLLEQAERFGAGFNGVCVQHAVGSRTETVGVQLADLITPEDLARKLDEYQQRVNQRIDTLIDRKARAQEIISGISDARYRALLTHRFLENLKWSTIADLMGYTQNWVEMRLKIQALEAFECVYKKSHVKTGIL